MSGQHELDSAARAAREQQLLEARVHQPGIGFPSATRQKHLLIVRIDLAAPGDRDAQRTAVKAGLLRLCGLFARIADGGVTLDVPNALGLVTQPLSHWHFTATVGFGAGFFDKLALPDERRPRGLRAMPDAATLGDLAGYSLGQTDLVLQLGASDDYINRFVLENALPPDALGRPLDITSALAGWATITDVHAGFARVDGRNLQGFLDGTSNPRRLSPLFDRVVWTTADDGIADGSYMVFQKIVHDLDQWRSLDSDEQEEWVGRKRATGLLLGTLTDEEDAKLDADMHSPDEPVRIAARRRWKALLAAQSDPEARLFDSTATGNSIQKRCPAWAHVRKANPRNEDHNAAIPERLIFRRGYPFVETSLDQRRRSGLLFVCFQRDLSTGFEAIKRDFLGSGAFPVPAARPFTVEETANRHRHGRFTIAELKALTVGERALLGLADEDDYDAAMATALEVPTQQTGREGLAGPSEHGVTPTGEFLAIVPLGGGYYFVPPIPNRDLALIGQPFFA